jgi:hypothetical protein
MGEEAYLTSSEFTEIRTITARMSNPHATRQASSAPDTAAAGMAGEAMLGTHAERLPVLLALLL